MWSMRFVEDFVMSLSLAGFSGDWGSSAGVFDGTEGGEGIVSLLFVISELLDACLILDAEPGIWIRAETAAVAAILMAGQSEVFWSGSAKERNRQYRNHLGWL